MARQASYEVLRIWDTLRTQQLEFLPEMAPGRLIYNSERYDFSASYLDPSTMTRGSGRETVRRILRGDYDRLELNEPTMIHLWRRLVPYTLAFRVVRIRATFSRREAPLLVLYAIDNFNIRSAYIKLGRGPARLRGWVFDRVFRALVRSIDRIAFGTPGAEKMYQTLVGRTLRHTETKLFPRLDRPCQCGDLDKDPDLVLFVGALDDRKGIIQLMSAWPSVLTERSATRLVIIGKGKHRNLVEQWAEDRPEVTFVFDPERAQIHRWYRIARTVVLLSQPHPQWREQVGLPITEGLSHGCVIVATSETGVAGWLADHGHSVISPNASAADATRALCAALDSVLSATNVLDELPDESARITADRWLMRP